MTQASLQKTKKYSPFSANFRQGLISGKKTFIILCILQIFGLPVLSVLTMVIYYADKKYTRYSEYGNLAELSRYYDHMTDVAGVFVHISSILFAAACAAGILCAVNSFYYMHRKNETDKVLSLPIKADHRFLSDYLSGLVTYVAPYLIGSVLALAVTGIGQLANGIPAKLLREEHLAPETFVYCFFAGIFTMFMLYTLSVFVTVCCGNTVETIMYSVIANIIIPLTVYMIYFSVYSGLTGIDSTDEVKSAICATSSIGGILKIYSIVNDGYTDGGNTVLSFMAWAAEYLTVTAVLFTSAFMLNRKRKAEDVSKPFVFSVLYYIFISAAVICIVAMASKSGFTAVGIIVSFIIFIVLDLIRNRGAGKLKKAVFSFAVYIISAVSAFSFVTLSQKTRGFGIECKVPELSSVKYASVTIANIFNETWDRSNFKTDDPEIIAEIISMHSAITELIADSDMLEKYSIYKYYDASVYHVAQNTDTRIAYDELNELKYITLSYVTKTGKKINRTYHVPAYVTSRLALSILTSDEGKQHAADAFEDMIFDREEEKYYGSNEEIIIRSPQYGFFEYNTSIRYDEDICRELSESFRKDIGNMTTDELLDFRTFCVVYNVNIPYSFTETINTIKKYADVDEICSRQFAYDNMTDELKGGLSMGGAVYTISSVSFAEKTNGRKMDISSTFDGFMPQYAVNLSEDNIEIIAKLLSVSEKAYYTSDDCYIFSEEGRSENQAAIPSEYSYLIEELISSPDSYEIEWENAKNTNYYSSSIY